MQESMDIAAFGSLTTDQAREALSNNIFVNHFIRKQLKRLAPPADPDEQVMKEQCNLKDLFFELFEFSSMDISSVLLHLQFIFTERFQLHPESVEKEMQVYSLFVQVLNSITFHRALIEDQMDYFVQSESLITGLELINP